MSDERESKRSRSRGPKSERPNPQHPVPSPEPPPSEPVDDGPTAKETQADAEVESRVKAWPATYGALVLLAAVVLFYSMREVLSPVLLFPLFILLLVPFAGDRRHRIAVTGATLIFVIWMLSALGSLLTPFLLAGALAYILDPAVDMLERRRIPRGIAILLLALPALGALAVALVVGIPALLRQMDTLLQGLPAALERVTGWLATLDTRLARLDIPLIDEQQLIAQLTAALDPQRAIDLLQQQQGEILRRAWTAALGIGRGFGAIAGVLGYVVLTPILLFYLLRDWDRVTDAASSLMPMGSRQRWMSFAKEYDRLLSRFLRGQLLAAAIVGVLTWVGLWIAGFPNAGLVGAVAAIFNIVPYLGLIVSVIPVVVIALISGNVLVLLVKAGIVFAIVQFIDGSVTGPRIVGESVGLHPVWVMLALAIAGFAFGFAGLLIAMPVAVLVKLLIREGLEHWRRSSVFRAGAPESG